MKNWDSYNGKNTFRLVLSTLGSEPLGKFNINSNVINDWIEWRDYQYSSEPELYVIKIGHGNAFENEIYIKQAQEILKLDILKNKNLRMAVYHNFSTEINIELYNKYIQLNNNIKSHFLSICTVLDLEKLINKNISFNNLVKFLEKNIKNNIFNIILLRNISSINQEIIKLLDELNNSSLVHGFDIVAHHNNFSNILQEDSKQLINFIKNTKNFSSPNLKEKLHPEFIDLEEHLFLDGDEENAQKAIVYQLEKFLEDGFLINMNSQEISPLIYGSADDFTILPFMNHYDAIEMTLKELKEKISPIIIKILNKNHCSSCEYLNLCSKQRIWWLNFIHQNKIDCEIGLNKYIKYLINENNQL